MKMNNIYAFIILMSSISTGVSAEVLCRYNAKISDNDKKNSAGTSLTSAGVSKSSLAAIIRQDRANYHQFKLRDAEDEGDCLFSDKQMRAKIEGMINSSQIDAKVIESIVEKNPVIEVTLYENKLAISVSSASNSNSDSQGSGRVSPEKQSVAKSEDNVLHDNYTGVSLRTDTKEYNAGGCFALLSDEKKRTGSINQGNTTKEQDAWIRTMSKKGRAITEKIKSTSFNSNLFEAVKNKNITMAEAEWYAGFVSFIETAKTSDISTKALIMLSSCEKAGYLKL